MERWPKVRGLARVKFAPEEFIGCIHTVEESMRWQGSRDQRLRLQLIGAFWGADQHEKALAFEARLQCMKEIARSPKIGAYTTTDPLNGKSVSPVALFHAAALVELQYDHDHRFFDEDEFLVALETEDAMLARPLLHKRAFAHRECRRLRCPHPYFARLHLNHV